MTFLYLADGESGADLDDDGLGHFVGNDLALALFAVAASRVGLASGITVSVNSGRFVAELGNPGFQAGHVAAQGAQAGGLLQLAAGLLQAQIE